MGLIAMSGIRVVDQELLRLGLTLPGFVERSKVIASLPSLGLLTLAGMTPEKHTVSYLEIPDAKDVDTLPDGFDLVGISSYCAQINEAYEIAKRYKDAGVPVVMGGPHVSSLPDEAVEFCNAAVVGEGELTWLDVLSDCEKGVLQPHYGSLDDSFDLKEAPMPAFELLEVSKYNRLTVQTSRGCPHRCEFCASSPLLTKRYSQKPVKKVLKEIDKIMRLWDGHFIEFVDDNAIIDRNYWRELLTGLKNKRIRWFVETDISVSEDESLLRLMHDSGCAQVLIGLESPVKAGLNGVELKNDWKLRRLPQYKNAINVIQSNGIRVTGCFVMGLDGQDSSIFNEVIEFVKETEMFDVQITIMTPFPGTPLYTRLRKEKRLLAEEDWRTCTLFDVNYKPSNMSVEELREGFKQMGVELYSDEFTKWRKTKFNEYLRKAVRKKGRSNKGK
ncbi:MAG: B12-binding domain-containing radical SAM protein [Candidatus Cloacimonadota bacterium]|nr:MAG: B12-binding domain-containing radical SAM protein [Candidatus Cloacimonadota bacterium]